MEALPPAVSPPWRYDSGDPIAQRFADPWGAAGPWGPVLVPGPGAPSGGLEIAPRCASPSTPPFHEWASKACFAQRPGRRQYYNVDRKDQCCEAAGLGMAFGMTGMQPPCEIPSPQRLEEARAYFTIDFSDYNADPDYEREYSWMSGIEQEAWADLMAAAWLLLLDHLDLLRWSLCYFDELLDSTYGYNWAQMADCLADLLTRTGQDRVRLEAEYRWIASKQRWGIMRAVLDEDAIRFVPAPDSTLDNRFDDWQNAVRAGDAPDALCRALLMAKSLLHELLHLCGETHKTPEDCECDAQKLVQNMWGAAVVERYGACFPTGSNAPTSSGDPRSCTRIGSRSLVGDADYTDGAGQCVS